MRQSELKRELEEIWNEINRLEEKIICLNEIKDDNPQEKYKQSVAKKGLPSTKEGVVTTESGDGKSPVDILDETKDELIKAVADEVNYPTRK